MSRIVLIEDNADSAKLAAKLLQKAGHQVESANEGESGFSKVIESVPDLVLVDLGLPDIDGQTIAAMMRQSPALEKVSIIAFTAWPQDTAQEMARAYGCDGVITKPINTRTFVKQVDHYLKPPLKA
jgi:CheY-like chemotaxis protein